MTKAAPHLLYEDNAVRNEEQGRNNICIPSEKEQFTNLDICK